MYSPSHVLLFVVDNFPPTSLPTHCVCAIIVATPFIIVLITWLHGRQQTFGTGGGGGGWKERVLGTELLMLISQGQTGCDTMLLPKDIFMVCKWRVAWHGIHPANKTWQNSGSGMPLSLLLSLCLSSPLLQPPFSSSLPLGTRRTRHSVSGCLLLLLLLFSSLCIYSSVCMSLLLYTCSKTKQHGILW